MFSTQNMSTQEPKLKEKKNHIKNIRSDVLLIYLKKKFTFYKLIL